MADAPALTTEDYAHLYGMSLSEDPSVRSQASMLAGKLTNAERQEFFNYQKSQTKGAERSRVDNSIGGLPPEAVVAGAIPVMGAMSGVGSAGMKAAAGLKAAISSAAPAVKYEVTKSALEHIGVPSSLAMGAAMIVSGYKSVGKSAAPVEAPPIPSPVAASTSTAGTPFNPVLKPGSFSMPVPVPSPRVPPNTLAQTTRKLVLTPEEALARDVQERLTAELARKGGMQSAARAYNAKLKGQP